MVFDFAHKSAQGTWDYVGTGDGDGRDAVLGAFEALTTKAGGNLPAGEYLYCSRTTDASEMRGLLTLWSDGSKVISQPRPVADSATLLRPPEAGEGTDDRFPEGKAATGV